MDAVIGLSSASIFDLDIFGLVDQAFHSYPEVSSVEDFGPYVIKQSLGKGGMGEVFLAHDRVADRPVAIKFIYDIWSAFGLRDRFTREIQNLAKLEHPSIARLYDAGIHPSGAPYFVMEYVTGKALDSYCREQQSSISTRVELFRFICQAVEYAHTRLIVHCDLKPSNILVVDDQTLKLVDFGVSHSLVALDGSITQTETLLGFTPLFAAPEQVHGKTIGLYTDVYALGVLLYQLLTGALPGNAKTPAEAMRYLSSEREPHKPSSQALKSFPQSGLSKSSWNDLDVLCLTALKKDPTKRYSSVLAQNQDLERYLAARPLAARRDSFGYRLNKFLLRNRVPLAVTASVVVAIALLITFFTVRVARERDRANRQEAATAAMNRFLAEDLLGRRILFKAAGSNKP